MLKEGLERSVVLEEGWMVDLSGDKYLFLVRAIFYIILITYAYI
jgi:hypothetical protein